jgi:hypothetical protein
MRFMVMHKTDAVMESGARPKQEIFENMGKFIGEALKTGVFKNGAGLHRSATRVRVDFAGDKRTLTKGPLSGGNQLVDSCVMIKARSMDEAVEHAERFAKTWGDGEIEIGPVVEPWDLGVMPKPADPPLRFLLVRKGSAETERGESRPNAALDALKTELKDKGVLLAAEDLGPSKSGTRLPAGKGKRQWMDGPFTESKELIAGFSIIEVPSREAAIAWAERYAAILDGNEVDLRVSRDALNPR